MISLEVKIQPGRGLVQFPHPRRDASVDHLPGSLRIDQAPIGTGPDTRTFREHLATTVAAAAAGAIADVLGTLGFRAQEPHMLDCTIATLEAVEKHALGQVLDQIHQ